MSDFAQTQSGLQAGNPPASPGISHSDVVVNLFREIASRGGIPGTVAPATSLPISPEAPVLGAALPSSSPVPGTLPVPPPVLPVGGSAPTSPPPIQSSMDLEPAETTNAVTAGIPFAFEPFGSEVLKSIQESGLGTPAFDEPALAIPHQVPGAPDYYFIPRL